nr:hypothetical protein LOCUS_180 [Candidatus Liberibacter asiaticus]
MAQSLFICNFEYNECKGNIIFYFENFASSYFSFDPYFKRVYEQFKTKAKPYYYKPQG